MQQVTPTNRQLFTRHFIHRPNSPNLPPFPPPQKYWPDSVTHLSKSMELEAILLIKCLRRPITNITQQFSQVIIKLQILLVFTSRQPENWRRLRAFWYRNHWKEKTNVTVDIKQTLWQLTNFPPTTPSKTISLKLQNWFQRKRKINVCILMLKLTLLRNLR